MSVALLLVSVQELAEVGVQKIGHRKKITAAISSVPVREHFLGGTKPVSYQLECVLVVGMVTNSSFASCSVECVSVAGPVRIRPV